MWFNPSPHVHKPEGTSNYLGSFSSSEAGCYVRAVYDTNINTTQNRAVKDNSMDNSIIRRTTKKAFVVARENIDNTEQGKQTYIELIHE